MDARIPRVRRRSAWFTLAVSVLAAALVHVFLVQLPSYLTQSVPADPAGASQASEGTGAPMLGNSGASELVGPPVLSAPDPY